MGSGACWKLEAVSCKMHDLAKKNHVGTLIGIVGIWLVLTSLWEHAWGCSTRLEASNTNLAHRRWGWDGTCGRREGGVSEEG